MTSVHFMQTRKKNYSYVFQSRINKLVFSKILRKGFKLLKMGSLPSVEQPLPFYKCECLWTWEKIGVSSHFKMDRRFWVLWSARKRRSIYKHPEKSLKSQKLPISSCQASEQELYWEPKKCMAWPCLGFMWWDELPQIDQRKHCFPLGISHIFI